MHFNAYMATAATKMRRVSPVKSSAEPYLIFERAEGNI